jgi:hypothetical protein
MVHERPILPREQRVDAPEHPYRWQCSSCGVVYIASAAAMHSERLPVMAFRVFDHYHLHRQPSHEGICYARHADRVDDLPIVEVDERDLLEALAWWEGMTLGKRLACEELRAPIDAVYQRLA